MSMSHTVPGLGVTWSPKVTGFIGGKLYVNNLTKRKQGSLR
jgi:hypothetical protein